MKLENNVFVFTSIVPQAEQLTLSNRASDGVTLVLPISNVIIIISLQKHDYFTYTTEKGTTKVHVC